VPLTIPEGSATLRRRDSMCRAPGALRSASPGPQPARLLPWEHRATSNPSRIAPTGFPPSGAGL
jgi:hypothetical protein